jgi:Na+-driven multidrug efflux pump
VLTIPVFIEMALIMMMGAIDTVMLSRYSDNSVAAVGLDNQLISLVFLVYQFFSMGAAILCAQYIGAGLRKSLIQVVGIALTSDGCMVVLPGVVTHILCLAAQCR